MVWYILFGYQDQQTVGWRIYLSRTNEFIFTAHASFEDHKARKSGFESRYTTEELSSVEFGIDYLDVLVGLGRSKVLVK